jgi:O-antigen ligase
MTNSVLSSWTAEETNTREDTREKIRSIGFKCALALVFLRFSALPEVIASITGVDTYIIYLFGPLALLAVIFSGGLRRTFQEKPAKFWLWFLVWIIIAVPFSSWKGGSFSEVTVYIKADFMMLLVIAGLARKWTECRKIIYTVAAAAVFNMATAYLSQLGGDRLTFSWSGTLGNSDDFAAHLLLVLPFLLFVGLKPNASLLVRLLSGSGVAFGLFQILKTASRGALIALVLTMLFLFFRGSLRQKVAVVFVATAILVSMTSLLPAATLQRLTSFSKGNQASEEALESSEIREYVLKQSVILTLQHPVLGVGPGQFSSYLGRRVITNGLVVSWLETHNSYTQISSECGIPALAFYLAAMVWTFRLLAEIRKKAATLQRKEITSAAHCLAIGLFAFSVAALFVNFGYCYEFPSISGLVISMWSAATQELHLSPLAEQTTPDGTHMESVEGTTCN